MSQWYYTRSGQQAGPVTFEKLRELATSGELSGKDLVWNPTMKDWTAASEVSGIFTSVSSNPYSTPESAWMEPSASSDGDAVLTEIEPGSEPIDIGACIQRAFRLCKANLGTVLLGTLVMLGISLAIGMVASIVQLAILGSQGGMANPEALKHVQGTPVYIIASVISQVVSNAASIFLSMGFIRFGLDLLDGKSVSPAILFSQGSKFFRAVGASILFGLMVVAGTVLLVIPGIYLALRFGSFLTAIVDRDMGIMESFRYSSSITQNNKLRLIGLGILAGLIALLGVLACGVGLLFTYPVAMIAWVAAYRWMQYGRASQQGYSF